MKKVFAALLVAAGACLMVFAASYPTTAPAQTAQKKSTAKKSATAKPKSLTRKQSENFLRQGYDSLQAKRYKQAITELSTAMNSGKLRRTEMAKALYYRGIANRGAKRPADAISDLTSALWLKGALNKKERENALAQRQQSYAEAGVSGSSILSPITTATAPTAVSAPKSTARKPAPPRKTAPANWATSTSTTKPNSTTTTAGNSPTAGITSFFSNLFSGSSSKPATASTATAASPARTSTPASTSSWSSATRITTASVAKNSRSTTTAARPRAPAKPSGNYHLQVALFRDRGQASTLAKQLTTRHRSLLGGRQPVVASKVIAGMGTFHYVQIKPFRSQGEAAPLCQKLLASGIDCLVSRRK